MFRFAHDRHPETEGASPSLDSPGRGPAQAPRSSFEDELYRAILRTPFWALSILLHVLAYLLFYPLVVLDRPLDASPTSIAVVPLHEEPEELQEETWVFDAPLPDLPEPRPQLEDTLPADDVDDPADLGLEGMESLFGSDGASRDEFDPGDLRGLGFGDEIWGTDFGHYIRKLRSEGLDVVFLFDSTSSMWSVIDTTKSRIDWMISVLHTLVPRFRLGIATYRDHGDEYVVRGEDLSSERYRQMAYLHTLQAAGGGDLEEAVFDGLRYCSDSMTWAPGAHRVIIVIGDAAPHPRDVRRALDVAKGFHRRGGVVHAVIALDPEGFRSRPSAVDAEEALRRIAEVGGGASVFLEDAASVVGELLVLTFGSEWRREILDAYDRYLEHGTWRDRWIRRKIEAGEASSLVHKLRISPIYPGLVRALVDVEDPSLEATLLEFARDASLPSENRWAAAYLLRRRDGIAYAKLEPFAPHPPRAGAAAAGREPR